MQIKIYVEELVEEETIDVLLGVPLVLFEPGRTTIVPAIVVGWIAQ